uniref:laccase n=1 Tax=Schizophyllum commune (strain H4-8 / FGSC 9210) TaxID=578458 RepID=D8PTK2_SCHCM
MAALLAMQPLVAAWAPDHILRINNATVAADCTERQSVTINGTSPGPTLRVRESDESVWIRVYNDMEAENTTLHWHGISQYGSPFADGTPATSQWPIAPGGYFDYEFKLDPGSAGTYMYHTHVGFSVVTAYGALIVEDKEAPPFEYDDERLVVLGDFYYKSDYNLSSGLLAAPFQWTNDPQALTVNGNAYGECDPAVKTCKSGCHTEVISVEPDRTYRIRVIGATALSFLYMALEDHPGFELIEVDGDYVNKHNASFLEVASGQRYSFLLHTKSVDELRALGKTRFWANLESRWRTTRSYGGWILEYKVDDLLAEGADPNAKVPQLNKTIPLPAEAPFWVMNELTPLDSTQAPPEDSEVSRVILVDGTQLNSGDKAHQKTFWQTHGYQYTEDMPSVPYLIQAYEGGLNIDYDAALANDGYDNTTHSMPIRAGEVVDIVFLNVASPTGTLEAHPWHIHGKHPYVMAYGLGEFSQEAYVAARKNMTAPIKRDTVMGASILYGYLIPLCSLPNLVYAGPEGMAYSNTTIPQGQVAGWTVFRLRADVPGAFMLHCHIQPHFTMGMGTVLLIGMEELPPLPDGFADQYL